MAALGFLAEGARASPVSPMPGVLRVATTLLLCSLLVIAVADWRLGMAGWLALNCWEIGVVRAALSAPLFWLALCRGYFINPVGHGAMVGLLAGLTGALIMSRLQRNDEVLRRVQSQFNRYLETEVAATRRGDKYAKHAANHPDQ